MSGCDMYWRPGSYSSLSQGLKDNYDDLTNYVVKVRGLGPVSLRRGFHPRASVYFRWLNEQGHADLNGVGVAEVAKFLQAIPQRKQSSMVALKSTLKTIMEWQCLNNMIEHTELLRLGLLKTKARHYVSEPARVFSDEDIRKIFQNINRKYPRHPEVIERWIAGKPLGRRRSSKMVSTIMNEQLMAIAFLSMETGLRVHELYKLKASDLDIRYDIIAIVGKFGKYREVPYSEFAKRVVKRWLAHRDLVVNSGDHVWFSMQGDWGRRISHDGFTKWIDSLLINSETGEAIEGAWHTMRKTFATKAWRSGLDIDTVGMILGHEDSKTTKIYLGINRTDITDRAKQVEMKRNSALRRLHKEMM